MRDWKNIDRYVTSLYEDIYAQPADSGHIRMMRNILSKWLPAMTTCHSVLDVGAGAVAIAKPFFEKCKMEYTGIALGTDALHDNVISMDMNFLEFPDKSFDLVYSRHSLEHSFSPLISLMEWNRVARSWLMLILPNPIAYGWASLNHYGVLHPNQAEFLMERAGWNVVWSDFSEPTELRYMAEKSRVSVYERKVEGKK